MEQDILSNLGSEVRKLRAAKKMTQRELAEVCNLSLPFINLIENNKRNVSLETLVKLLSALEVSLSDFFLPFSQTDESLTVLLHLLLKSPKKAQYIELFTQILKLSEL
ncbi:helix-turn-helix transcriptional regulator [Enterococcus sp. BWB1-3]|uniref:helix-turn-helix domain-containing protein n=1 Tax=unclassified Enterococcus TaxID=2608891 RepID=UPI001921D7B1|nr:MULTISPECIES: helix-turn-helix transcriptional regulator [unclassified Enterococcus]MBL1228488.1 helix-turn-helix transcriptional regulator [Enterococcus sp. BWB1-3]MCB5950493.1 helix-turn-helix domain-containing protein [Enterococcus sp. BWT-B8]